MACDRCQATGARRQCQATQSPTADSIADRRLNRRPPTQPPTQNRHVIRLCIDRSQALQFKSVQHISVQFTSRQFNFNFRSTTFSSMQFNSIRSSSAHFNSICFNKVQGVGSIAILFKLNSISISIQLDPIQSTSIQFALIGFAEMAQQQFCSSSIQFQFTPTQFEAKQIR